MTEAARNRLLITTGAVVLVVLAVWFLVISPKRSDIVSAQQQRESAQQQLTTAQSTLAAGQAAQQELAKSRSTLVRLGRVVPTTDDTAGLLVQLQSFADRRHVKLDEYRVQGGGAAASGSDSGGQDASGGGSSSTRETDAVAPKYAPGSTQIDGGLARTTLSLTLTGTYHQLEAFLRDVQRSAVFRDAKLKRGTGRLFVIDGVSYGPSDAQDGKSSSKLKASLTGSVYYAPPVELPDGAGAAASTTPAPGGASTQSSGSGAAAIGGLR